MKRCALILLLLPLNAYAWTTAADRRIASEGAKHAPADLLFIVKAFSPSYARGIEKAQEEDAQGQHRGDLRARIERETRNAVSMLRSNAPMAEVVERLGLLAHLVGDANNPYHVAGGEDDAHADFERYFERKLAKFPTIFYGRDHHGAVKSVIDAAFARAKSFAPLMAEEYANGSSATFDDLSTAFGIASVSYSHSVTDTANLFTSIWKEAGGVVLNAKN